jgi:hypothetical protein
MVLAACLLVRGWIGWNYERHLSFTSIVSHHGNGAMAIHAMNACFAHVFSVFWILVVLLFYVYLETTGACLLIQSDIDLSISCAV